MPPHTVVEGGSIGESALDAMDAGRKRKLASATPTSAEGSASKKLKLLVCINSVFFSYCLAFVRGACQSGYMRTRTGWWLLWCQVKRKGEDATATFAKGEHGQQPL